MSKRVPLVVLLAALAGCEFYCGRPCLVDPNGGPNDADCAAEGPGGFCRAETGFCEFSGCRNHGGCDGADRFCVADLGSPFGVCTSPPPALAVTVGPGFACALLDPGDQILCWGDGGPARLINPDVGLIEALSAGNGFVCFRDETGEHNCVGSRELDLPVAPGARALAASHNAACVLDVNGGIQCAGDAPASGALGRDLNQRLEFWSGPDARQQMCVVRDDQTVECDPEFNIADRLVEVCAACAAVELNLADVAVAAVGTCVSRANVNVGPTMLCDEDGLALADAAEGARLFAADGFICARGASAPIVCPPPIDVADASPVPGPGAIDAGGDAICWIEDDAVRCASPNTESSVVTQLPW